MSRNKNDRRNRHLQSENADDKSESTTEVIDDGDKTEVKVELTDVQIADARLKSMTKQMTKVLGRTRYWMGDNMVPCGTVEIKEESQIRGKKTTEEPLGVWVDNCDIIEHTMNEHKDEADIRDKAVYVTLNLRNSQGKMQEAILTKFNREKLQAYVSFDTYVDANIRANNTIITHDKAKGSGERVEAGGADEGQINHFAF